MGFVPLFVQDFGSGAMERIVGSRRCFVHPGEMGLVPLFVHVKTLEAVDIQEKLHWIGVQCTYNLHYF